MGSFGSASVAPILSTRGLSKTMCVPSGMATLRTLWSRRVLKEEMKITMKKKNMVKMMITVKWLLLASSSVLLF